MREIKKKFARCLRKKGTAAEEKLWRIIRNRRLCKEKFRRQHVIEGFVVDFYCMKYKLAIELDGPIHNRRREYDRERENIISSEGVRMLRFKNEEVMKNTESVLRTINREILNIRKEMFPLPQGEGCPAIGGTG